MPHTYIAQTQATIGTVRASQVGCTSSVLVHITRLTRPTLLSHGVTTVLIIGIQNKRRKVIWICAKRNGNESTFRQNRTDIIQKINTHIMKSTKVIMKSNTNCASYLHWTYISNYRDGASEPSKMHMFRICAYHKDHSTNHAVTTVLIISI